MAPRALARSLHKVTRPVLAKRGRTYAALVADWAALVGPTLADCTLPEKLVPPPANDPGAGGTLHVRVAGAGALELQHHAPLIIDRLNTALGQRAVARLKLIQAPLPLRRPAAHPPAPPSPAEAASIAAAVAPVEDPGLRSALERLGRALAVRRRSE